MYSLLTEELNKYDSLAKNNIIEKKTIIIDNKITTNIEEPSNNENKKNEICLNIHNFNPLKNSPPSLWQFRLLNRINSLKDLENISH